MSNTIKLFNKCVIFITGASKGIGRSIAVEISTRLKPGSIINIIARTEKGLEETKNLIANVAKVVNVNIHKMDLSKPDIKDYNSFIQNSLKLGDHTGLEYGIVFHNAASIGFLQQTTELTELSAWQNYYNLNFFSMVLLNSAFIKHVRSVVKRLVIINITSYYGHVPEVNVAMYGSGKAARDIFLKIVAKEEPEIVVLNYSPGAVDTNMYDDLIEESHNVEMKKAYKEKRESRNLVLPVEAVKKLLDIMESGKFLSGDVVDYYNRKF